VSRIEDKLAEMSFELPEPCPYPNANRTAVVQVGSILYVSGHGPGLPDLPGVRNKGRVGEDVSIEEGYATARAVMLMIVASLKQFTGDLDHLK